MYLLTQLLQSIALIRPIRVFLYQRTWNQNAAVIQEMTMPIKHFPLTETKMACYFSWSLNNERERQTEGWMDSVSSTLYHIAIWIACQFPPCHTCAKPIWSGRLPRCHRSLPARLILKVMIQEKVGCEPKSNFRLKFSTWKVKEQHIWFDICWKFWIQ